jgi:chemotaxis protein MotB
MASVTSKNIIRKIEVVEGGGHHGGAWKVAYADFMTAMMAFFLLMWILSSSDEQKLKGIAEYFTNATLPGGSGILDGATLGNAGTLSASNGATVARGVEAGEIDDESPTAWEAIDTIKSEEFAAKVLGRNESPNKNASFEATSSSEIEPKDTSSDTATMQYSGDGGEPIDPTRSQDEERFDALEAEIRQAMQNSQDLRPLMENVVFERTPEGLRIQIIDQEGRPMFPSGSDRFSDQAAHLVAQLGESLSGLPNDMVISGHTDSRPFADSSTYDNWDLSSDRANTVRRVLVDSGVEQMRITRVSGMADTEPLMPETPDAPQNRRISLLLAYQIPNTAAVNIPEETSTPTVTGTTEPSKKTETVIEPKDRPADPTKVADSTTSVNAPTTLNPQVFENLRSALQ